MVLELECLFAAPGGANDPEAVQYLTFGGQTYIAYASGPGIVICKHDLALEATLAFDDAFPTRPSTVSPASTAGLAVDRISSRAIFAAWRGKQAAIWTASSTSPDKTPTWRPLATLSIDEEIISLSLRSNILILGTARTIECWTADLSSSVPIFDSVWTRSSGPCGIVCLAPDLSHVAWTIKEGSEAYVQRLKSDLTREDHPQVLKHSKCLSRLSWRDAPEDPHGYEPVLLTQTSDSCVRMYKPVLDDPLWFQLIAAIDLYASIRRSRPTECGRAGFAAARRKVVLPFVVETVPSGFALAKKKDEDTAKTFVAWVDSDSNLYTAEMTGIDKCPPQLVQIKVSRPQEGDLAASPPSTQPNAAPGALRFIASDSPRDDLPSGTILLVPARTPGMNVPYSGLVQYAVRIRSMPASTTAKRAPSNGSPGFALDRTATSAQGYQPRAELLSAGSDGRLLFRSPFSSDRVMDIALRQAHKGKACSGLEGSTWCLERPEAGEERISDKGLKSMKVFERAGIRLSGSAAGLRIDRRKSSAWQESHTLEKSEPWELWSAVYPYELKGMGQTLGCFDLVVIALSEDPWGLDGHAWRVTIDTSRQVDEPISVRRETVTLPDPAQHAHSSPRPHSHGSKIQRKEWKNIPMSHKEGKTLRAELQSDGYWRVPCAFAISDGSGEVILLDLAGYPGKAPLSRCMGHAMTTSTGREDLKVYPQGLVMHIDKANDSVSLWSPSDRRVSRIPEFRVSSQQTLVNADLITSDAGYVALVLGEISSIRVFCQRRRERRRPRETSWHLLAELNISRRSPYPLTGVSWLPGGEIALSASRQLLIVGLGDGTGLIGTSLLDLVDACNSDLPQLHPVLLEAALVWDRPLPSSAGDGARKSAHPLSNDHAPPAAKDKSTTLSCRHQIVQEAKAIEDDVNLTPEERQVSSGICMLLADLDESGLSVDQAGMRFLATLRAGRAAATANHSVRWDGCVWAGRSVTQETLVRMVTLQAEDQRLLWPEARETGVFLWITSNDRARALAEVIARNQFLAGDRDPIACSLLYFALGKKSTVHGLWRQVSGHAEQNAMLRFLVNDFTLPRWKSAAMKNAYALLGRQRYEYAAAFFILAGQIMDAVNLCVKHLKDWQLGLTIARLADPDTGSVLFSDVIERIVLPIATEDGSRWSAYWTLMALDRKGAAVAAILSSSGDHAVHGSSTAPGSDAWDDLDPALLALLADIKQEPAMALVCTEALRGDAEMRFVLECVRAYWQMGCRDLAVGIMRDWRFERSFSPTAKETKSQPPSILTNGHRTTVLTTARQQDADESFPMIPKMRSEKAGVMAIGEMKDSRSSQGAAEFDMGSFF